MGVINRSVGGLIKYYGLEEWYSSLTEKQQGKIKEYYAAAGMNPREVDSGNCSASTNAAGFLWPIGNNAVSSNDYEVAEIILDKALEITNDEISRHYSLLGLIELTYKKRNVDPTAIEKCKKYCLMDMDHAATFVKAYTEDFFLDTFETKTKDFDRFIEAKMRGENLKDVLINMGYPVEAMLKDFPIILVNIPSFTRLAIIFEKEGKIQEAIEVCKKAISLGLRETKKDPYENRIAKLEKKLKVS